LTCAMAIPAQPSTNAHSITTVSDDRLVVNAHTLCLRSMTSS
jgi:hypothetical protein